MGKRRVRNQDWSVRDCELAHHSEHAREEENGERPQTNSEEGVLEL